MLAEGDAEGALARLEPVTVQAEELELRPRTILIQDVRSRALLHLGRADEAVAAVDAVLPLTEQLGIRSLLWRLYAARAAALAALGRHGEAASDRRTASTIVHELAATVEDEELRNGFLADPEVIALKHGE